MRCKQPENDTRQRSINRKPRTWTTRCITLAVAASINLIGCNATTGGGGGPTGNLVGVWQSTFFDPTYGAGTIELILGAAGDFQQQTIYQAGSIVTVFGTFRVFTNEALLRLDILRGEPSEACGPLGCTQIIYPAGESHAYTLNADGTLTLTNINCTPGATVCTFNYARAA